MKNRRKARRKERYNHLRSLGFTSHEANKLKDRSKEIVEKAMKLRIKYNKDMEALLNGD